jgi:hypothetical protein
VSIIVFFVELLSESHRRNCIEPSALAAGLEVGVDHDIQPYLSAKSDNSLQHLLENEQFEPPYFETRS